MKRHAIAIGRYRARPTCDARVDRIIRAAFRRAILAIIDKMGERVRRRIWEPYFQVHAIMYETACAEIAAWNEWAQREVDEQIAGKMSDVWEPER